MKRLANYLIAMALMAFTFTSCEDVPNPFGQILPPSQEEEAETIEPAGSNTKEDPYNVAAIQQEAAKLGSGETSTSDYWFKGKISSIKYTFNAEKGTATFYISDDGTSEGQFYIYSCLYLGNKNWAEGDTQIKEGDEVIIFGKLTNYNGTLETASKKAYIYSLNNKTEGGGDTPASGDATKATIKQFLDAAESTSTWYELTGTVSHLEDGTYNNSKKYGNFDLSDETGTVYVYGVLSEKGGSKGQFEQLMAEKGIKDKQVAGDADILMLPDLDAGNPLYKALAFFGADMEAAAVLVGPKIPVILPSRADDPKVKLNAIALCSFLKGN